jgi:hypothetical protein
MDHSMKAGISSSDIVAIATGTAFVLLTTTLGQLTGDTVAVAAGVASLGLGYLVNMVVALNHGRSISSISTTAKAAIAFGTIGSVGAAITSAICAVL